MTNITVYDFMYMNIEDKNEPFLLWDCESGEYIHDGGLYNLPEEYEGLTVESWNIAYSNKAGHHVVCLNVSLED